MKRLYLQTAALLLGAAACGAQAGDVLTVEGLSGTASVDRLGTRLELKPGDQLSERDLVHVAEGGSLSLGFSGHGFIELGSGAELGIEKLPFASYADDLKTIFSLSRGYLRVVWKLPPLAGGWPLYVYFGSQHAALIPGEYFFDSRAGVARACVSAGRLSVLANAGTELQKLRPSACYRFVAGLPPARSARDGSAWIAVRHGFDIDAPSSPEALLAANDSGGDEPDAEPALAPPPPPPAAHARPPAAARPPAPAISTALAPAAAVPPPVQSPPPASPPVQAPPGAAAPAAMAAAAPAPAAAQGPGPGEWGVNVASYPAADVAQKHAQQLQSAGYSAAVQQAQVRNQTWFRVQLRGYPSADAARAAAAELQARFAYQGLWVTRTGP